MKIAIKNRISVRAIAAAAAFLFTFAGAAHANVRVRPTAITFGTVASSTTTSVMSHTVTVTNESYRHSITISKATTSISQFSFSGPALPVTLAPGKTLVGTVSFNPTSSQSYSGRLVFEEPSGTEFSVALSGTGSAVTPPPPAVIAPAISTQPASVNIVAGKTATFNVAATGTSPMTYQWRKNGAMLSGATSSTYTTPAETTTDNNAAFTVSVSNSAGTATSNAATLTVAAPATAPSITSQPASQTIVSGKSASFTVSASGTSPMTYQWSKNGAAISGAASSTYTTPAETTTDNNAKFTVAVSNSAGNATSNAATLTVTSATIAPAITTQPASQSVLAGKTASFSVAASGTSPMTFQWSKNGAAISGATAATYTTPAETTTDNSAQFTVAVSNSAGSATSNAAVLTVTSSTLLLNSSSSSVSFGSVTMPNTGTQSITLTNAGNSTITVSNVSVSGAGFNASGVSAGLIMNPGQTATLTTTFTPSTAGSAAGSVSVASNASNSPDSITLSGTGVAAVSHSVSLSWTPSTSTVVGYNAYSSSVSGGPYTKLTNTPVSGSSYTDSNVTAGQTYFFVVTSVDSSNNESAFSTEANALVP
ncbi:MAG TPA: immunoglobulin domain-containing protein [Candidatus Acidoferrales bacterium]|nr:immunoglobulin domain-containing protein [Candidatus Acidoferrales bacterium]